MTDQTAQGSDNSNTDSELESIKFVVAVEEKTVLRRGQCELVTGMMKSSGVSTSLSELVIGLIRNYNIAQDLNKKITAVLTIHFK